MDKELDRRSFLTLVGGIAAVPAVLNEPGQVVKSQVSVTTPPFVVRSASIDNSRVVGTTWGYQNAMTTWTGTVLEYRHPQG